MKDVCVKAKAKMGKIPSDDLYEELISSLAIENKINILKRLYPSINYDQDKKAIEYDNFKAMYQELESINYFLKGLEKKFFNAYFSKYEILFLQEIIEALVFGSFRENYLYFEKSPLRANFILREDMDLESFINANKKSPYYRVILPFLNKGVEKDSVIFLSSNQLIKNYYRNLLKLSNKFPKKEALLIEDFLGEKINLLNFEIIYRLKAYYDTPDDEIFNYLIDGGRLYNAEKLKKLANLSTDDFITSLKSTRYSSLIGENKDINRQVRRYEYKLYKDQIRSRESDILYVISAMEIIFISGEEISSLLELDETFTEFEIREYLITR